MIDIRKINDSDIGHPVEIGDRIWWVGHYLPNDVFQCNVYLIENEDQSALIDPGGMLTFSHVRRKVEEVVPFSSIRNFICHHQDPDITGALKTIDSMPDRCKEAIIVTHWRAKQLIKHYDLNMPFWEIEENGWNLDLGNRILKFIFTPYLHFPGAFCTFDAMSGTLFSSDIFGGMTSNWSLVARDESYFEDVRPFHEHYMPSREILLHGLVKIEEYPVKLIAPQHGSIITGELVSFMINKLKNIDCGIYALAQDKTDIRRLSFLNKTLKDITKTMIIYRDFRDIANALVGIFRRTLPVVSIEFYVRTSEGETLFLGPEARFNAMIVEPPEYCSDILSMDREIWLAKNPTYYRKCLMPSRRVSDNGSVVDFGLIITFFSKEGGTAHGLAVLRLAHDIAITTVTEHMIEGMSDTLGVAVEREILYRALELERNKFYNQSIRDPLTGLYNRQYMEEASKKLMSITDRKAENGITLAMIDIDYFKKINDTYGHAAGDDVLRKVGSIITGSLRSSDLPVRFGGEEFAIFLVGDSIKDCIGVTERIRHKISLMTFEGPLNGYRLTVSAGVARHHPKESICDLIHRADMALYKAKSAGRNRVYNAEDIV